jgi:hypothetical protein
MTTKTAIIATVGVVLGAIGLGLGVLFLTLDPSARDASERAARLGDGMAKLMAIPIGAIWILWAVRFRKDRERQNPPKSSKKRS